MTILHNKELLEQKSDFIHFISYVNCPELFLKAVKSTGMNALKGICIVFDNRSDMTLTSPMEILETSDLPGCVFDNLCFVKPDVPLTTDNEFHAFNKFQPGERLFHMDTEEIVRQYAEGLNSPIV